MERKLMTTQKKLDEIANNYNKTKDPKYKKLWYEIINGLDYIKRRPVSTHPGDKTNVRGNSVDRKN